MWTSTLDIWHVYMIEKKHKTTVVNQVSLCRYWDQPSRPIWSLLCEMNASIEFGQLGCRVFSPIWGRYFVNQISQAISVNAVIGKCPDSWFWENDHHTHNFGFEYTYTVLINLYCTMFLNCIEHQCRFTLLTFAEVLLAKGSNIREEILIGNHSRATAVDPKSALEALTLLTMFSAFHGQPCAFVQD